MARYDVTIISHGTTHVNLKGVDEAAARAACMNVRGKTKDTDLANMIERCMRDYNSGEAGNGYTVQIRKR